MKILIVTQYFWPESFLVNGLSAELQKNGHDVTVLTGLPNYPKGQFAKGYGFVSGPWNQNYKGLKILRVPIVPRGRGYFQLMINYISFVLFGTFFSLFRIPKDTDVIFCFAVSPITTCLPAIFIRWRLKKPLVLWVQDLWPESISAVEAIKSERILKSVGRLVRFIYRRCDLILTQSQAFHPSILKWGGNGRNMRYLPNWAEPFVERSDAPAWVENLPAGFKIGFAGNIGKAQDLGNLLDAAERLRAQSDIKWIVVGDGSEKKWLNDEIEKRGLQSAVLTVGHKPYDEMLPFFKSCDALLVSLTDKSIFSLTIPSKVQAYMSAGRPILSTVGGEASRVIREAGAGFAVEPQKPDQLCEAVLKMKNLDPAERNRMGANGLDFFAKNFEKSRVIKQAEDFLKQAVKPQQLDV